MRRIRLVTGLERDGIVTRHSEDKFHIVQVLKDRGTCMYHGDSDPPLERNSTEGCDCLTGFMLPPSLVGSVLHVVRMEAEGYDYFPGFPVVPLDPRRKSTVLIAKFPDMHSPQMPNKVVEPRNIISSVRTPTIACLGH